MRLRSLDVLRAIAVLLVLGRHFNFVHYWSMAGWTGVDLFFVLSGFLISGLLFSEYQKYSRIHLGRFLVRRGFKIYPPFYLMIFWSLGMLLVFHRPIPWPRFIGEFFFLQNYYHRYWGPTWTLAVEEHFYLALPLLLFFLAAIAKDRRDPFRSLPGIFLGVAAAVYIARLIVFWPVPDFLAGTANQTQYCIDGLLFGVVISYFYHFRRETFERVARWRRPWVAVASCLCIAPCLFLDFWKSYFIRSTGHVLLYLGYGGLLMLAVSAGAPAAGRGVAYFAGIGGVLAYLGRYSYSIYLWNEPVGSWGMDFLRRTGYLPASRGAQFLIYLACSLAVGILLSKLVEYPALKVRDRLFPSLSVPLTAGPAGRSGATPDTPKVSSVSALLPATEPPLVEKG